MKTRPGSLLTVSLVALSLVHLDTAAEGALSPVMERLWPDAVSLSDGWYQVKWYGYVRPAGDWFYHFDHGWQYGIGHGMENLFVYDLLLGAWGWTTAEIYPSVYWYWPVESWTYYRRPGRPGERVFYHDLARAWRHESQLAPPSFSTGTVQTLAVSTRPVDGYAFVMEPATESRFAVPGGESGEIRVAPLHVHHPLPPYPGEGWRIEMDGLSSAEFVLQHQGGNPDTAPTVYVFGQMHGAFDDAMGYGDRWVALPWRELERGLVGYSLPVEEEPLTQSAGAGVLPAEAGGDPAPRFYYVSRVDPDSPESEQRMWVGLQLTSYIQQFLDALEPSLRQQVEARRAERHLTRAYGGNYYTGFNRMRAWSWGRRFQPVLAVKSPSENQALAHETGHYLTHLLVGHDAYDQLERAGGSILGGNHGIRDEIGRNNLLEDYAYYLESFLIETGGNYYLTEPNVVFRGLTPLTKDFPGLEGFAASMLALLHVERSTLIDYVGDVWPIAPLGLSWGEVFSIVAGGHTSVDALRQGIENRLSSRDKQAFQVLLHRLGWRYKASGRLVDRDGNPIASGQIHNVASVGDATYFGTYETVPVISGPDGRFMIIGGGGVFGGESFLRVTVGQGDPVDVPIQVAWTGATDRTVELGDIVVDPEIKVLTDFVAHDHVYTGSGWPPEFRLHVAGDFRVEVRHPNAAAARFVRTAEAFEPNRRQVWLFWDLYVPTNSTISVSGRMTIEPNATSGANADVGQWRLVFQDWPATRMDPVGEDEGMVSLTDTEMVFAFEIPNMGWRAGADVRFMKYGYFQRYWENQDIWVNYGFAHSMEAQIRLRIHTE